jgi:hypothetical protein
MFVLYPGARVGAHIIKDTVNPKNWNILGKCLSLPFCVSVLSREKFLKYALRPNVIM